MRAPRWIVAEAKAKFSEIIERAMSEGPQTITKKGRTAAVVVGAEEWEERPSGWVTSQSSSPGPPAGIETEGPQK